MIVVCIIAGILGGAIALGLSLALGASLPWALAAHAAGGAAAMLLTGLLLALRPRQSAADEERAAAPAAAAAAPRILAVDDDPLVLELVVDALSGRVEVATAGSAPEAMARLDAPGRRFDGFLIDILMRETDGIELCRHLRADPRYGTAPVAMLTRKADLPHIERAFAAGADDYIIKPFQPAALADRVAGLLRLAPPPEPRTADEVFAHPFEIAGLRPFLRAEAAQNLLVSLAAQQEGGALRPVERVMAFRMREARRILDRAGPEGFRAAVGVVAQALAAEVRPADAFLAYVGEGVFLGILRRDGRLDPERTAAAVNGRLRRLQGPPAAEGPEGALAVDPVARGETPAATGAEP